MRGRVGQRRKRPALCGYEKNNSDNKGRLMHRILIVLPAILAFSSALGTGLVFGLLPARQASRLDPVAALASE